MQDDLVAIGERTVIVDRLLHVIHERSNLRVVDVIIHITVDVCIPFPIISFKSNLTGTGEIDRRRSRCRPDADGDDHDDDDHCRDADQTYRLLSLFRMIIVFPLFSDAVTCV